MVNWSMRSKEQVFTGFCFFHQTATALCSFLSFLKQPWHNSLLASVACLLRNDQPRGPRDLNMSVGPSDPPVALRVALQFAGRTAETRQEVRRRSYLWWCAPSTKTYNTADQDEQMRTIEARWRSWKLLVSFVVFFNAMIVYPCIIL